jgi:hypothetical protein
MNTTYLLLAVVFGLLLKMPLLGFVFFVLALTTDDD